MTSLDATNGRPRVVRITDRQYLWITILALVAPIWLAVVRAGWYGLYPTWDAAVTVLRAHDVGTISRFPLVGMRAAGAQSPGLSAHFPGATELYWLAGPTKLFGDVWGPLIAMALASTLWLSAACWLVVRHLPMRQAMVVMAMLAIFAWSIGPEYFVNPVPLKMVVVPFVVMCIAAWCAMSGDRPAMLIATFTANFLLLNHLVLTLAVPAVVGVAMIGCLLLWWRERFPMRGTLGWSALITVVLWTPSLIQQLTTSPGNLRILFASTDRASALNLSWPESANTMLTIMSRPPFWFRGTIENPPFLHTGTAILPTMPTLADTAILIAWIIVFAVLAVLSYRRRDRLNLGLLAVAAASTLGMTASVHAAPFGALALATQYILGVWVAAMLTWLAVVVTGLRLLSGRLRVPVAPVFGVALVFVALSLPAASLGDGLDRRTSDVARHMIDVVTPRLAGQGTIMVTGRDDRLPTTFRPPLLLALRARGIPYCGRSPQGTSVEFLPACDGSESTTITLELAPGPATPQRNAIFEQGYLDAGQLEVLDRLNDRISNWLNRRDSLALTPEARKWVAATFREKDLSRLGSMLNPSSGDLRDLSSNRLFLLLVTNWSADTRSKPLFVQSPISTADLRTWTRLRQQNMVLVAVESKEKAAEAGSHAS